MTNYTIWADRGSGDAKIYEVGKYLEQCCGGSVKILGIGPGIGQQYGLSKGQGTTGVFMTNGVGFDTPEDFEQGIQKGYYKYDSCIFVWPQFIGNKWMSNENIKSHIVPTEHDIGKSLSVGGKLTAANYFSQRTYVNLVAGTSPQDIAQRICNRAFVTSNGNPESSSQTTNGMGTMTVNSQYSNPMLAGDKTFQEIISEICDGIDILFLCKKNHVLVTDFEQIYSDALYLREHAYDKVRKDDIKLWELEDGSYQLNVDQFGFYNAVVVYYNGGKVYEQFDDLVDVYGAQVKIYNDKTLTKSQAQAKAKAYLAAHVRDFNMGINASVLENGIDIGDIVTLKNPLSYHNYKKIPEYLFVQGVSISWDGDYIYSDLELKYGPESPERPEVPVTGVGSVTASQSGSAIGSDAIEVGNTLASKYKFNHSSSSYCGMRASGGGDCFAWSAALWQELKNIGYTVRIVQYPTSYASNHRSVQYKDNTGQWIDYPYSSTNIPWGPQATSGSKNGTVVVDENGLGPASNTIC